jgi:Arylsulfotransferase (ASST)
MATHIEQTTRFGVLVTAASAAAIVVLVLGLATTGSSAGAQQDGAAPIDLTNAKSGLVKIDLRAFRGYTLFSPMNTKTTYLIDMEGLVVKKWESEHVSIQAAYLLENGHLFRVATLDGAEQSFGGGSGAAGRIQEFAWDGSLVWDFQFHNDKQLPHHDAAKMPSGNVLLIVWDKKTAAEALAAGRKPNLVSDYLLPDSIIEVKPTGKTTGEVVWEWHLWDHLVQNHDSTKASYGEAADHPELVNINFVDRPGRNIPVQPPGQAPLAKAQVTPGSARNPAKNSSAEKLSSIGYVGSTMLRSQRINPDWTHVNSVDYNPALDQIVLSVCEFSEIWIIDHSTTTAEAAGHTGGRSGKGGDLLYRWGNPRAYLPGTKYDQKLVAQHNAHWIPPGLPGQGHLLVFNNGGRQPGSSFSSVDELVLPVDSEGRYAYEPGAAYEPRMPVWSYSAANKPDFYAFYVSGAHRLPNGNTLVCSGPDGTLFEVTREKEVVWKYVNPVNRNLGPAPGGWGASTPPLAGQLLPLSMQSLMGFSAEQQQQLAELQKTVDDAVGKLFSDEQKAVLRRRNMPGRDSLGAMPAPGQVMAVSAQIIVKPTPEQKKQLADLQKTVHAKLDQMMTPVQKIQFKNFQARFSRNGPSGGPPGTPGGGPASRSKFTTSPVGPNAVFRAYRYGPDYPGLAGKDLKPGKTVLELEPKEPATTGEITSH